MPEALTLQCKTDIGNRRVDSPYPKIQNDHDAGTISAQDHLMTDRSVLGEHHDDAILRFSSKIADAPEGDIHLAMIARLRWHEVGQRVGTRSTSPTRAAGTCRMCAAGYPPAVTDGAGWVRGV